MNDVRSPRSYVQAYDLSAMLMNYLKIALRNFSGIRDTRSSM